jgi:hypothetical protein
MTMEQIDFKGREIESVEYGENEIVVKLKAVKFEPKRWRAKAGEPFYRIGSSAIYEEMEGVTNLHDDLFNLGNYYQTKEQAQAAFDEIKLVFAKNL